MRTRFSGVSRYKFARVQIAQGDLARPREQVQCRRSMNPWTHHPVTRSRMVLDPPPPLHVPEFGDPTLHYFTRTPRWRASQQSRWASDLRPTLAECHSPTVSELRDPHLSRSDLRRVSTKSGKRGPGPVTACEGSLLLRALGSKMCRCLGPKYAWRSGGKTKIGNPHNTAPPRQ